MPASQSNVMASAPSGNSARPAAFAPMLGRNMSETSVAEPNQRSCTHEPSFCVRLGRFTLKPEPSSTVRLPTVTCHRSEQFWNMSRTSVLSVTLDAISHAWMSTFCILLSPEKTPW